MGSITNWSGIAPKNSLSRNIDDFFNSRYRRLVGGISRMQDGDLSLPVSPATNVRESENTYTLELELPGFGKNNIEINVLDNILRVHAQVKEIKNEEEHEQYSHQEFHYRTFERAFTLPRNVREEDISASYRDGIVIINLPVEDKPEVAGKTRRIPIA